MVGSTGTLMTMRLVRSKLRKREETSSASPATNIEAQTTTFATTPANQNHHHQHNNHQHNNYHHQNNNHRNSTSSQCSNSSSQNNQQMFSTSSSTTSFEANHNQNNANMNNNNNNNLHLQSSINSNGNCNSNNNGSNGQSVTFVRQSPASNGWVFPPKAPTPNIYNCSNNFDAIVNANDKHGFKGFRKQFSGRFKRLVAKKPAEPAPAIPPELKPQLKTIFVY